MVVHGWHAPEQVVVTNISLFLLVRLDTLQLAMGATGLLCQGVTAVVHGCSIHALDPSSESSHTAGGVAIGIHQLVGVVSQQYSEMQCTSPNTGL